MQTVDQKVSRPPGDMLEGAPGIEAAGLTDIGQERDSNEDSFLIATLQRSLVVHDASLAAHGWFQGQQAGTLLVVADGMGGQGGGAVASSTAVNAVVDYLLNVMPWTKGSEVDASRTSLWGVRAQLSSALVAGDATVKSAGADSATPHMGTTLTIALLLGSALYVAHVGDTRCYLLQAGVLSRLTTDHNLAQKFAEMSPAGSDPPAHLQNILWNALGGSSDVPRPELAKVSLTPGATLLLCSDGLNKHVTDEQIQSVLESPTSCAARCARLVELANAGGGSDNITAVIATVGASNTFPPPPSR